MDLFRSSVEKSEIDDSDEGKVNCPSVMQLLGGNQSLALASSYEALTPRHCRAEEILPKCLASNGRRQLPIQTQAVMRSFLPPISDSHNHPR